MKIPSCPSCGSEKVIKNGSIHNGKPKFSCKEGRRAEKFVHRPAIDVLGVNSRVELAQAHAELQLRRCRELMLAGVTIYSPETVLISPESIIGQDAVIHAGVHLVGLCQIGAGAVIGAHSVLHGCAVAAGEQVPPLT